MTSNVQHVGCLLGKEIRINYYMFNSLMFCITNNLQCLFHEPRTRTFQREEMLMMMEAPTTPWSSITCQLLLIPHPKLFIISFSYAQIFRFNRNQGTRSIPFSIGKIMKEWRRRDREGIPSYWKESAHL